MLFAGLSPSQALQLTRFANFDHFRPGDVIGNAQARNLPINLRSFSATRARVGFGGFQIVLHRTFPRIVDANLNSSGIAMLVPLKVTDFKINGVALENGSIVLSQGRTDVQVFEPVSNEFALVSTPLSLETLELSAMADKTIVRASERVALDNLRSTIIKAVQFASSNPNAASQRSVEAGMQQSLSLAIERVLSGNATATWDTTLASRRHAQLVSGVDEYLRLNPEAAIYSEDLARLLGVSVSTLKSSVLAIRGMSIHRYLRLRRLWSVRRQLMNGVPGLTIKQSALANGFWHMGEFSSLIRRHLENPPR